MTREAEGAWASQTTGLGRYAEVNGVRLYYETLGEGRPLIVLHGGLGSGQMFGPNLALLAKGHQVIAVDLQGHGRTADIERPLSTERMAGDIAALIEHLGLERPDLMGYSLGGGVALIAALRHPELVGKLVLVSTPIRRSAFYAEILAQQGQVTAAAADAMKQTPMYQLYASIAPKPEDWPRLLTKIGDAMKIDFDYSKEIAGLTATTLIVAGDADIFPPGRTVRPPRRRQARWGMGRLGTATLAARHPAGLDPLHDLQCSGALGRDHPVPRCPDLAGSLIGRRAATLSVARFCVHRPLSRRTARAMRVSADSTAAASPSLMYAAKWRLTWSRWIGNACRYFASPASARAMCRLRRSPGRASRWTSPASTIRSMSLVSPLLLNRSAVASWVMVRRRPGAIRSWASASNQVSGSPQADSSSRLRIVSSALCAVRKAPHAFSLERVRSRRPSSGTSTSLAPPLWGRLFADRVAVFRLAALTAQA